MIASYCRPESLREALELMASGEYSPIAGGTDLIPQSRHGKTLKMIDISKTGLDFVNLDNGYIEIGATTSHSTICENDNIRKSLPLLLTACSQIGSWQIRNRGTIGGNIVNASPCADTAPALLNYDAELTLITTLGKRRISLNSFVKSPYATDIRPDELLHSIRCKPISAETGNSYTKLGRRQAVNISRMTLAISISVGNDGNMRDVRISAGSVFPSPERIGEVERFLENNKPSDTHFAEAGNLAAELMINRNGQRWSTPYKKPVLIGLIKRGLAEAARLEGHA